MGVRNKAEKGDGSIYLVRRKIINRTVPFFVLAMMMIASSCFAASDAALVKSGNSLYNKGKIDEALKNYNQALVNSPDAPLINFNIGNSLYRKKQYSESIAAFEKALLSPDRKIEAKASYNIGNCKFRSGRQKEISDIHAAITEYRSALDYYKRAAELDADDKEAKFNHEFVEKYLKSLIDKVPKQQKEPGQGSSSQEKEQQKQQEQKSAQAAKSEPAKEEKQGQGSRIKGQEDKEMTKEEAAVLLNDFRQQEQQERRLNDRHAPQRYQKVEKDW